MFHNLMAIPFPTKSGLVHSYEKELHSASGHIIDFFIVSQVSFSSGFLDSISKKYSYQDISTSIQTQATTEIEEQTYGIRLHLKAAHKSGLDLYVGNGIASIVAMKKADNIGEVEKSRGTGKYTEGGLKYVSQFDGVLVTMPVKHLFYCNLKEKNKI